MKYVLIILLVFTIAINANEFTYIKPIAVEEAPKLINTLSLDNDSDGVINKLDKCPNTKIGIKVDKLGCILKKDADKDGITNNDDKCPNTLIGQKVNKNGCEVDSDSDGVIDSKDKCADTDKGFFVDVYGCPQIAIPSMTFEANKYKLLDEDIKNMKEFAEFLKKNKDYQVVIYGYTDSLGDNQKNKILSQNRADAIKKALIHHYIKRTRLTALGRGEVDPIADNDTPEGRAKNRRIKIELLY